MARNRYTWVKADGQTHLATPNLAPGIRVYKEKLVKRAGTEYRVWDPHRSKLAAVIMNGLEDVPLHDGDAVLYLGASTGTTVSHVSDMVGPEGVVFAVEHTSRVARELLDRVAVHRQNIIPVLQDARRPSEYVGVFGRVDAVYCDIAQPDQTRIAMANCDRYLKNEGHLMLIVKARSIDVAREPSDIFRQEESRLVGFSISDNIDLRPYHKDHSMIVAVSMQSGGIAC